MNILITNDDGILSPCLLPLAKWAQQFGEVTVIAPKRQQSGKSHSLELHEPFEVAESDALPGVRAFTVDSTPADCVRVALLGWKMRPDLVISGINCGYNMGTDILYSGTAGAVFESALLGIPSVALSTDVDSFDPALENLDRVRDFFLRHELFAQHVLYNVNFPPAPKGIRMTRQGGMYFTDLFDRLENGLYKAHGLCVYEDSGDLSLDTDAVMHGYISVSPLTTQRTEMAVFERLKELNE